MATTQDPPLDEVVWRNPQFLQAFGGVHTNSVLPYFAESPWFDRMSNNNTLTTRAFFDQNTYHVIQTREAFESALMEMQGVEYMVSHDPSEKGTVFDHNGVWIIRKQERKKRKGMTDEIVPMSSYFVIGENIYMAPSVGNILNAKLLSTVKALTTALPVISSLARYTPALGHTYTSATSKLAVSEPSSSETQNTQPVSSMPSETSPPGPGQNSTSNPPPTTSAGHDIQSLRLLEASYDLLLRYGNEYMDENPIIGEPGNFKMTNARDLEFTQLRTAPTSASQPFKAVAKAVPPPIKTDVPSETSSRGLGNAKSPTTPGGKKSKKERKKSRSTFTEGGEINKPLIPEAAV